jgi:hypothetical protein
MLIFLEMTNTHTYMIDGGLSLFGRPKFSCDVYEEESRKLCHTDVGFIAKALPANKKLAKIRKLVDKYEGRVLSKLGRIVFKRRLKRLEHN